MKAFEKGAGQKPTLAQVQGFIKEVDTNNDNAIDFEEFVVMVERVNRGELPRSTGKRLFFFLVVLNVRIFRNSEFDYGCLGRIDSKSKQTGGKK